MDISGIVVSRPDWSELSADVLENVFSLFESIADCINFCAVCASWRSAITRMSTHKSHLLKQAPWLMIPYDRFDQDGTHTVLSLANGKAHTVHLPETNNREIIGSSHGWLILLDKGHKQHNPIMLQPITGGTIELPPLTTLDAEKQTLMLGLVSDKTDCLNSADLLVRKLKYGTISSSPSIPDNDWVVTISLWSNTAVPFIFYRKGSHKWSAAAPLAQLPGKYFGFYSFSHYYNAGNMIVGKDYNDIFWAWKTENPDATPSQLKMLLPPTSSLSRCSCQQQWYYVAKNADLPMPELSSLPSAGFVTECFEIHTLFITGKESEIANHNHTWQLNGSAHQEACLLPCKDIGENVLLVEGSFGETVGVVTGASFPGARRNCVYFVEEFESDNYGLGVHDLKKKTVEWLPPRWRIFSYCSIPFWFLPSF